MEMRLAMVRKSPMISAEIPRFRRVLLQMDTSTHCRETLDVAIDIAAHLRADLHGIFVEDSDLISVGGLDFVREFSLSSPTARTLDNRTLDLQLKALASSARRRLEQAGSRRKVTVGFHTVRGDVQKEVANATQDADLIIVEGTGRLHARFFGTQRPGPNKIRGRLRPTLLLKGGKPLTKQFTIISDSVETARKCLEAAATLTPDDGHEFALLPCATTAADAESLTAALQGAIGDAGHHMRIAAPVALQAGAILRRLGTPGSLLVVADDGPLLKDEANARLLFESRHPLLLVH
jgi:nucleotide-binding universal stress UspA family protein